MRWAVRWVGGALGVALSAAGCSEGLPSSPRPAPARTAVVPLHAPTPPIRRLRRLSGREYDNVVRDLLGDVSHPASRFTNDVYPNGYDNGAVGLAVQSDLVASYQAAAEALADHAVNTMTSTVLGGCDPTGQNAPACVESFLGSFAARAYRRPLTETEKQRLRDVFASESARGQFSLGLRAMLEVILQSPQFLYREELGPVGAVGSATTEVSLTDYEVASELSFLFTGSLPDAELWAAAGSGRLRTVSDFKREAARLLATPGARDALRAFLHEWFATDRLATLTKDPGTYPTFDAAVAQSMSGELDRLFDAALWSGTGSLRDLFSSTVDAPQRAGILSRAGFLAVHAATDSSGPISRGTFVLQSIMCAPPAQPPANIPPAPAPGDPGSKNLTTRQRFAKHVASPFCASCHTRIDGIGFGFEEYDGVGAYRTTESGQPIDSRGAIVGTGEIDGPYSGVAELSARLGASRLLAECFTRQAYRYAMGQVEGADDDVGQLAGSFSTEARMIAVLLSIVESRLFTTRSVEASGR